MVVEKAQESNKKSKAECKRILNQQFVGSTWEAFTKLNKQNLIIAFLLDNCKPACISAWNKVADVLPKNIFSFLRRAVILALPTNANLKTWNMIPSEFCPLCKRTVHTQHHILNHCKAAADQQRHNSVLNTIMYQLSQILTETMKLYVDIPGFKNTDDLFESGHRPDLVLETNETITVLELTICFETNLHKSREYKINKYKNLGQHIRNKRKKLEVIFVEFSSLGFYSEDIKDFRNLLKLYKLDHNRILEKCSETCIRSSYYIFNRRCKDWTLPQLMLFY